MFFQALFKKIFAFSTTFCVFLFDNKAKCIQMNEQSITKQAVSLQANSLKTRLDLLEKENESLKRELSLKNETKDYISVLDNIPLALINLDLDGNFIFGNAFFYGLFDLEQDFHYSKININSFSQLWGTSLIENIQSLINHKKAFDIEAKLKFIGPERIYKARGLSIKDENDTIQSFLIIIGDITQRKRAEFQLIHEKERAEESDRLKTAFIANISHEIRTPINHIMGFLELLSLDDLDADTRNEYRGIIFSSSQSLLSSIENIIDIARIKSGQIKLKNSDIRVNDLIISLEDLSKEIVIKNNKQLLDIRTNIPSRSDDFVINVDGFRLKQILKNLIENAIKFTNEGSVEFGYKPTRDGSLYFFVNDTGIGIDKENYQNIFDNFRQVDYRTTREVEGSGLGLSISQGLSELMGAKLEVRSVIGKGSIFSLHFPKIKCNINRKNSNNFPKEIFDTGF